MSFFYINGNIYSGQLQLPIQIVPTLVLDHKACNCEARCFVKILVSNSTGQKLQRIIESWLNCRFHELTRWVDGGYAMMYISGWMIIVFSLGELVWIVQGPELDVELCICFSSDQWDRLLIISVPLNSVLFSVKVAFFLFVSLIMSLATLSHIFWTSFIFRDFTFRKFFSSFSFIVGARI